MSEHTHEQNVAKLRELLKDNHFAMLTTLNPDSGSLHSRPMGVHDLEEDNSLWFFTRETAPKVTEATSYPQVSVTFSEPQKQNYVALSGTAELVTDKDEIKKRWSPALKGWFPEGPETPDIALLHFRPERAEYWEGQSNPLVRSFEFAKAALTGQTPNLGENEKVEL
jgi:general stress protein 26